MANVQVENTDKTAEMKMDSSGGKAEQQRGSFNKGRRKKIPVGEKVDVRGKDLDTSIYTNSPVVLADVATITTPWRPGTYPDPTNKWLFSYSKAPFPVTPPGVMVFDRWVTPGYSTSLVDGVNQASFILQNEIFKVNKAQNNYHPSDVMIVMSAIDSVFTLAADITRGIGLLNIQSGVNLYYAEGVFNALYGHGYLRDDGGRPISDDEPPEVPDQYDFWNNFSLSLEDKCYDYRDACNEKTKLISSFNQYLLALTTLFIPTEFGIIKRHSWLFQNVFADRASDKAQYYGNRLANAYMYTDDLFSEGSGCVPIDIRNYTIDMKIQLMGVMISQLRQSSSVNMMLANLENAFPDSKRWTPTFVNSTTVTMPTESLTALQEFHNIMGAPTIPVKADWWNLMADTSLSDASTNSMALYQFTPNQSVVFQPQRWVPDSQPELQHLLDWMSEHDFQAMNIVGNEVDPITVAQITQSMWTLIKSRAAGDDASVYELVCATDFVTDTRVYYKLSDNMGEGKNLNGMWYETVFTGNTTPWYPLSTPVLETVTSMVTRSAFDWAPQTIYYSYTNGIMKVYRNWEIDNIRVMARRDIMNINRAIVLNLWDIPVLGSDLAK